MPQTYEFAASGISGTVSYSDGLWCVQWGVRSESHRLLRVALPHALGVGPQDVAGLTAKILSSRRPEETSNE
jgi:hypothetical protein